MIGTVRSHAEMKLKNYYARMMRAERRATRLREALREAELEYEALRGQVKTYQKIVASESSQ